MICAKCNQDYGTQPYCTSVPCLTKEVLRVEINPKGGFLTFFEGSKYPAPFYPKQEDLGYVDTLKRVIIAGVRFLASKPFTVHRLLRGIKAWLGDIYAADHSQHPNRFPEEDYSEAAKEFLRALISTEPTEYIGWCYYLTAIWNTDQAYGLRGKDVLQNLDKNALQKHPVREIMRLVDLSIQRELTPWGPGVSDKTKTAKNILRIALFSKTIRDQMSDFLTDLNAEKMQFTTEERYWLANKFDYNYEGKSYEERMAWKEKEDEGWVAPQKEQEKPRLAINPPNKAFYELNEPDAKKMCEEAGRILFNNWKENHI